MRGYCQRKIYKPCFNIIKHESQPKYKAMIHSNFVCEYDMYIGTLMGLVDI